jgi:uncharacterized protein (TIGR03437 family)
MKRFALGSILLVLTACVVWGQAPYVINTVAGRGVATFSGTSAKSAQLYDPGRVATDAAGNLYFSDSYFNQVFQVAPSGAISVVAGNGTWGHTGDGGPAKAAQLDGPAGIALDKAGNLYIADKFNDVIRMVTPAGIISTFAGDGNEGYLGDGGPATQAELDEPTGLAFDSAGNLYIADSNNAEIRQVTPTGTINTVAGNGFPDYAGDGGSATQASLDYPEGVAVDAAGNLYIADTGNFAIRKVAAGTITTYAGYGDVNSGNGDGGQAYDAVLDDPVDVAVDATGNVYIADDYDWVIRKVTASTSIITTYVGDGNWGFGGDGGPLNSADLGTPTGIGFDASGNLYIAQSDVRVVRKVSAANAISTAAGIGSPTGATIGDGGSKSAALLLSPSDVKVDSAGNMYIAELNDNRVRKVSPSGTITTLAGTGAYGITGDGGSGASAQIQAPNSLALDSSGNLYIGGDYSVRKVTPAGAISSVASSSLSQLGQYVSVAADSSNNLYVADGYNSVVYKVTAAGAVSVFAGDGNADFGGDGGPATLAELYDPSGVAVDAKGNVYISDDGNSDIRMVNTAGIISTVVGNGTTGCAGDGGLATQAEIAAPEGLTVDSAGNIYFTDIACSYVRMVSASTGIISTFAGTAGYFGYSGDGGPAVDAYLGSPNGAGLDSQGNVYIADTGNEVIREVSAPQTAQISSNGIVNAASFQSGPIAPGEMVSIFGTGIGPATGAGAQLTSAGLVSTSVAQTQVTFNGTAAPLIYVSSGQINAVVPYEVAGNSTAQVQVQYGGGGSNTVPVNVAATSPAIFVISPQGQTPEQGAILNQDSTINGASNAAAAGSVIQIYATGEGVTNPSVPDGTLASGTTFPAPVAPVSVTIGGQAASVTFAGTAPGGVAGFLQVNAVVPSGAGTGSVPITLTVGSASSPAGVTVALR